MKKENTPMVAGAEVVGDVDGVPGPQIDVPKVKTAVNAHNPTAETVRALVAKLTGHSEVFDSHNDTYGASHGTPARDTACGNAP